MYPTGGYYGGGYDMYGMPITAPEPEKSRRRRSSSRGRDKKGSKSKKRSKSKKSKKKKKHHRDTSVVPNKEAYLKLLEEIREWNSLKKRNIIINTFLLLDEEDQTIVRKAIAKKGPSPLPFIEIPRPDKSSDVVCQVNTVEMFESRTARLPIGSYVLALRKEWGFFAIYKKKASTGLIASFTHSSSSKGMPTWQELVDDKEPLLVVLFLDISEISSTDSSVRISTLTASKMLKLTTTDAVFMPTLTRCHKSCRPVKGSLSCWKARCTGEFYIDGEEFFPSLADAISLASHSIFMAAWWMSPYVFLKREDGFDQSNRLDNLLQRKAFEGVKIYILLYQEVEQAIALTSLHTKTYLESLHANIKVLRHRAQLKYTHHQKFTVIDWHTVFIGGLDPCYGRWDTHKHPLLDTECKLFPGLDYRNPCIVGDDVASQTKTPFQSVLNREAPQHRLPWHDMHLKLQGRLAYYVGLNFVQRWHHHYKGRTDGKAIITPYVPSLYSPDLKTIEKKTATMTTTLCRSMSDWSGNPALEKSIYEQYLNLIRESKRYIYVENQYFISSMCGSEVSNKIAEALVDRITTAHYNNETFRVFMLIQPHGEGDPIVDQFIRSTLWFQNTTISKMKSKLSTTFKTAEEMSKYFIVGCIQKSAVSESGKVFCSSIYIHSKLILSDDIKFIVGSANINDRSFNGDRDSEIGVLVQEDATKKSLMNKKEVDVGPKTFDLRTRLWAEHTGLSVEQLADPTSDKTWSLIQTVMQSNTAIFEKVFPACPSDNTTTIEEAAKLQSKPTHDSGPLKDLQGHIITYPSQWLMGTPQPMISQASGAMFV